MPPSSGIAVIEQSGTTVCSAAGAVVTCTLTVPVIELFWVSVADKLCVPVVLNVTPLVNVWAPLSVAVKV